MKRKASPPRQPRTQPIELPRSAKAGLAELRRARRAGAARYRRRGEVAQGGMALVVQVWDSLLHRPLAMKLQPTRGKAGSDEAVARFLREGAIAAQLRHPGVIPVHDLGLDERGRLYYTMPLVEGRELGEVLDRARTASRGGELARALAALAQVCDVVRYAHLRGVIHGDLKPSNVLLGPFDEVYVLDWGLATLASDDGHDGAVSGTPPYMSPEQAEGHVGFPSDVYAVGAMLYRLLAGRSPYAPRRGHEDAQKTIELVKRGPPTPIERLAPDAPAGLAALCERAMAREPDERGSPEELAAGLRAIAATLGAAGRERS